MTSFISASGSNLADLGRARRVPPVLTRRELAARRWLPRAGRPPGRPAAYRWRGRWDTAGLLLRRAGNGEHGNRPVMVPGRRASGVLAGIGAPTAERAGRGGAAVVLRGRESRSHGEGRQRFREGKEAAMPQDAPPDGGARDEVPQRARARVAGMQAKLHRGAVADPGRRFDDLFNFV
jgi:hypothetical protein